MRIAILDDYQSVALESADWTRLPADCDVVAFNDHVADHDALVSRLTDFEVVGIMRERTPFPRELIERLPNLRLLVTTGMRNAAIDLAAASERGIVVSGTASSGRSTLELTFGLMLALTRNIALEHAAMKEGRWQSTIGGELDGKTLGVLGLGRIGAPVAEVGQAFGMSVIGWSENLTRERAHECGVAYAGKGELFETADIISIHLVLSERTRGLIGATEFEAMKPEALLINTARGPIVDEAALIDALGRGQIAGAALDVFDVEPLPTNHPLRQLDNVVLTPHLGYVTREIYAFFYAEMVEDILGFLEGSPIRVIPH